MFSFSMHLTSSPYLTQDNSYQDVPASLSLAKVSVAEVRMGKGTSRHPHDHVILYFQYDL